MGKNCVFLAISYTERRKVENAIRSYLESKGLEVITGRDVASGGNLCDEIIKLVDECDFGVVVYNELRHNISYEWGLLNAMSKYVVVLKDENIHIDLDYELSDKKGTIFTAFYGEDTKEEIIQQLKEDRGLERALEDNIEKRISKEDTPEAKKASELLVKSDLRLGEIPKDIKELPNNAEILKALDEIKNLTAEGHIIKGNALYTEGEFKKAINEYNQAIELDPKYFIAFYGRGISYYKLKKFDDAIKNLNKTIELVPEFDDAYNARGIVNVKLTKLDDAIKNYSKAIEIKPEYALYTLNLAEAYILSEKHKESFEAAQTSLENSEIVEHILVSKFLITISLILQDKGKKEENELIEYAKQNKGCRLSFEFDTLKTALKDSKYSEKIDKLIQIIEENATD